MTGDAPGGGACNVEVDVKVAVASGQTTDEEAASAPKVAKVEGEKDQEKFKRSVVLLNSVFEGRCPVLFFQYTTACGAPQRKNQRTRKPPDDMPRMGYSMTKEVGQYNAFINNMRIGGLWRVRPETFRWSLLWAKHPTRELLQELRPDQKTNHYPGSWHLGRKDLMWQNLAPMLDRFGAPYDFSPKTFVVPEDAAAWREAMQVQPEALWIWKPCNELQGRGIKVLSADMPGNTLNHLSRRQGVVQRYIHDPLLIEGVKFDLRVYVVVISYEPLKVYLNHEGLVRMATEKYTASTDTLSVRTMHLTNYSINKHSPAFIKNNDAAARGDSPTIAEDGDEAGEEAGDGDGAASKWSFQELRSYFGKRGWDYDKLFDGIKDLVVKTMIAVEPAIRAEWSKTLDEEGAGWEASGPDGGAHRASCFEILGFDVCVDSSMKPWLLEVNITPSFSSGSPLDKRIKTQLLADTFTLVGFRPLLSASMRRSGGFEQGHPGYRSVRRLSGADGMASSPDAESDEKRAAQLLACPTALDAVSLFNEEEWEMVMEAHDEEMRSGSLERIFPVAHGATYAPYFQHAALHNVVLQKFYEAGGADLLNPNGAQGVVPAWLPRLVSTTKT